MDISRQTMLSIALFTVSMSAWVPWVLNVNVTNFPLDEEGNLKVSPINGEQIEPSWKVISARVASA